MPFYVCAKTIQGEYLKIPSNIPLTNQVRVICASQLKSFVNNEVFNVLLKVSKDTADLSAFPSFCTA